MGRSPRAAAALLWLCESPQDRAVSDSLDALDVMIAAAETDLEELVAKIERLTGP